MTSGVVASSGGTSTGNTISVPTLAMGATEGLVFTNTGKDTISSDITGSGGLTIGGPGNLVLPQANSYNDNNALLETQTVTLLPSGVNFSHGRHVYAVLQWRDHG